MSVVVGDFVEKAEKSDISAEVGWSQVELKKGVDRGKVEGGKDTS